jgi:hypothetical protein
LLHVLYAVMYVLLWFLVLALSYWGLLIESFSLSRPLRARGAPFRAFWNSEEASSKRLPETTIPLCIGNERSLRSVVRSSVVLSGRRTDSDDLQLRVPGIGHLHRLSHSSAFRSAFLRRGWRRHRFSSLASQGEAFGPGNSLI